MKSAGNALRMSMAAYPVAKSYASPSLVLMSVLPAPMAKSAHLATSFVSRIRARSPAMRYAPIAQKVLTVVLAM